MNTVALYVGWAVLAVAAVLFVSAAWKAVGNLIWERIVPDTWKESQRRWTADGAIVSPALMAVMFLLGGPADILRLPRMVRVQIEMRTNEKTSSEREATGVL